MPRNNERIEFPLWKPTQSTIEQTLRIQLLKNDLKRLPLNGYASIHYNEKSASVVFKKINNNPHGNNADSSRAGNNIPDSHSIQLGKKEIHYKTIVDDIVIDCEIKANLILRSKQTKGIRPAEKSLKKELRSPSHINRSQPPAQAPQQNSTRARPSKKKSRSSVSKVTIFMGLKPIGRARKKTPTLDSKAKPCP